nr:MBL fold metallo-hydrolase [Microbacterium bovistercoris]
MHPISAQQHQAATTGGIPEPERIDDGLWSVPLPMPGSFLTYTLGVVHRAASGAVTVIDPGWDSDAVISALDAFLARIDRRLADVRTVVVTHAHPDHIGSAGRLRSASGARVVLGRREQASIDAAGADAAADQLASLEAWGVPDAAARALRERMAEHGGPNRIALTADILVDDGDQLPVDGLRWRTVLTPGHTPGHICIADEERRILFSGDHILPTVYPGLGLGVQLGTNPLADYLRSLRVLAPYDEWDVAPGHGYRFRGLGDRRRSAAAHALRRAREVAAAIAAEAHATTWDVASRLTWSAGWEQLSRSGMLGSALLQTDMYRSFVEAGGLDDHPAV